MTAMPVARTRPAFGPVAAVVLGALVLVSMSTPARADEPTPADTLTVPGIESLFAPETPLVGQPVGAAPEPAIVFEPAAMQASFEPEDDKTSISRGGRGSIAWGSLFTQSLALLTVQHIWRATFEDGTWDETKRGIFWDDYFDSLKTFCCWDDGDKWTTNYLFHPMMGSTAAFVFANNHEDSQRSRPGASSVYWSAKAKQFAFSTVYGAYFELGPLLSECAIGNVGLTPGQQTWVDMVVTPTIGTAFSIGEDLLRVHVIEKVDRKSHAWGIALALLLNPTRSVANAFALKAPWSGPAGMR